MSELEIDKILTLSTGHVTNKDAVLLEEDKGTVAYKDDYGFILYILEGNDGLNSTMDIYQAEGFSMAMEACILFAHGKGCKFLRLDSDGPTVDFLPNFNW
jgi:hypothetical protein